MGKVYVTYIVWGIWYLIRLPEEGLLFQRILMAKESKTSVGTAWMGVCTYVYIHI